MTRKLTLGYSTCPNDTFIFHALAHGIVTAPGIAFDICMADVERLNQDAEKERQDVTKLSVAALGHLTGKYALLRSGGALGRGCGPLIVAKPGFSDSRLAEIPIAVPGLMTTAAMLLGLYLGKRGNFTPMNFDRIMPAVERGDYAAGVIIHEGRFTFKEHGLVKILDMGEWWEGQTGLPIPLGCIAIRRVLGPAVASVVETAIRESTGYAFDNPDASRAYIRQNAQEMAGPVIQKHIDLYVNEFSRDLGAEGEAAVERFLETAREAELLPLNDRPLFACNASIDTPV